MPPGDDTSAQAGVRHITLYVAIGISQESCVVGVKNPASKGIGSTHSDQCADFYGLGCGMNKGASCGCAATR